MEELIELVLQINKDIKEKVPHINAGGCGIFAEKMYKQLKELGYSPNIVVMASRGDKISEKKEILNNIMNNQRVEHYLRLHTSFAHCCIEVSGLYFDGVKIGEDFLDRWSAFTNRGNYTIEELELALRVGGWNEMYDRTHYNPIVDRVIKKTVKQVFHVEQVKKQAV